AAFAGGQDAEGAVELDGGGGIEDGRHGDGSLSPVAQAPGWLPPSRGPLWFSGRTPRPDISIIGWSLSSNQVHFEEISRFSLSVDAFGPEGLGVPRRRPRAGLRDRSAEGASTSPRGV